MIVAVTGATGYVGRFVVAELQQRGVEVRAWTRPGAEPDGFTGPVKWMAGDLRTPAAMEALVTGADAVVHAAFEHVPGRYRGGEGDDLDAFLSANLMGTLRLMEAARHADVGRFVFLSSRAVYGGRNARPEVDEGVQLQPDTHYGAYKAAVEAFASSWSAQGLPSCSLRVTGVYGLTFPEERTKWLPLVSAILRGEGDTTPRGGTEVHGADVARAVWLLLADPAAVGNQYCCSDLYLTTRDITRAVQRLCGTSGPLPAEPEPKPSNLMACRKLRQLDWRPGGRPLLESTLKQIVEVARLRLD